MQVHTSRDCCCPAIGCSQSRVRYYSTICGQIAALLYFGGLLLLWLCLFRIGHKDCPIMGKCNICSTISLAAVQNRCRKSNPSKLRPYRTAKARAARLGRKLRHIPGRNRSSQPLSPLVCIEHYRALLLVLTFFKLAGLHLDCSSRGCPLIVPKLC